MSIKILTPKQIAEQMGCDHSCVLRWIYNQGLPATRIPGPGYNGGFWAIAEPDLDEWLKDRC